MLNVDGFGFAVGLDLGFSSLVLNVDGGLWVFMDCWWWWCQVCVVQQWWGWGGGGGDGISRSAVILVQKE